MRFIERALPTKILSHLFSHFNYQNISDFDWPTMPSFAVENMIRKRSLANVGFIGELYKKGLLTDRIMHVCITKLLRRETVPHEEDLEALCKLMTTIGPMIDDHQKSKAQMDVSNPASVSETCSFRTGSWMLDCHDEGLKAREL